MARLSCTLEPVPYAPRERSVSYRFRIENLGDAPVRLLAVTPLVSTYAKAHEPKAGNAVVMPTDPVPTTGSPRDVDRTIHPGASYETRFDVRYQRHWINPSPLTFAVDATLDDGPPSAAGSQDTDLVVRACATETIAPNPLTLTAITVAGAVLGALVRLSLDGFGRGWATDWLRAGLAAGGLAGIVFNTLEYVDLGRRVQAPATWRGALLVGALCGLFSEQIMDVLGALVGAERSDSP